MSALLAAVQLNLTSVKRVIIRSYYICKHAAFCLFENENKIFLLSCRSMSFTWARSAVNHEKIANLLLAVGYSQMQWHAGRFPHAV